MRQMNRGRLNLLPPAGLDVTWARRMCPHCEDRSANYLAPLGAEKEERGRGKEKRRVRSSGQLMGKGIKDEEVTVKVEKRIFTAVREVRQQQHD